MSEWAPIGSFAKIRRGASPRPIGDPKYFGGNVGWVRIVDVTRSKRYLRATEQYLSPLGESLSVRVRPNDLIMSICGTIGRPIIIDMHACIHDGFVQFYDIVGTDLNYFYYVLFHAERDFQGMGQPGTQVNLNTSLVGKKEVFRPSLPTQQKIARILQTVDRAMEKTEALIEKYQQIKAGLMHDLFTRGLWTPEELDRGDHRGLPTEASAKVGQLRPTRQDAPHLYQETPIGWIPKSWVTPSLGELVQFDSGYAFKNQELSEAGIKVVRITNLHRPTFPYWHYDGKYPKSLVVDSGDLLFSWAGVASSIDCYLYQGERALLNQHIYNFRTNSVGMKPYLFHYLQCILPKLRENIEGGAGQLHLTKDKIQGIKVLMPPDDERRKILNRLQTIQGFLELQAAQLAKLQKQKSGLMHDLLTGKVPVTPDPEAAGDA